MICRELCDVHTDTDTDVIGFQTHCVGADVGKGKICVGVGQCEHTLGLYTFTNESSTCVYLVYIFCFQKRFFLIRRNRGA